MNVELDHDVPSATELALRVERARSDYLSVSRRWRMFSDYPLAETRAWERLVDALREHDQGRRGHG